MKEVLNMSKCNCNQYKDSAWSESHFLCEECGLKDYTPLAGSDFKVYSGKEETSCPFCLEIKPGVWKARNERDCSGRKRSPGEIMDLLIHDREFFKKLSV
jgi:hypothetical protein